MMHSGHFVVVRIAAFASDESLVFFAQHPCADTFNTHIQFPPVLPGALVVVMPLVVLIFRSASCP